MPPTLAPSLQRSRSVPRPVVLDVQFLHSPGAVRAGDIPAVGRRVQTDQYCNPIPGSPLWALALGTRSLLSCSRWFLTPHWRYPQSALGRWSLWLLRPIGAQTQASRCRVVLRPKLCCPSQTQVISKFPNFQNTTSPYRCPHSLQKPSIRSHQCNGKSLSWTGLTRERWCCTRNLVSRLDMSTCQTSIKTDILL